MGIGASQEQQEQQQQPHKPQPKPPKPEGTVTHVDTSQVIAILSADDDSAFQKLFDDLKDKRAFFEKTDSEGNNPLYIALKHHATKTAAIIIEEAFQNNQLRRILTQSNNSSKNLYADYLESTDVGKTSKVDPVVALSFTRYYDPWTKPHLDFFMRCLKENNIEWVTAIYKRMPAEAFYEQVSFVKSKEMFRLLFERFKSDRKLYSELMPVLMCSLGVENHQLGNCGNLEFVEWLMEIAKMNINDTVEEKYSYNYNNNTPLHTLLQKKTVTKELLEKMFKYGAKVDITNKWGLTAVHEMVLNGDASLVQFTLDYFPKFNVNMIANTGKNYLKTLIDCALLADSKKSNIGELLDVLFKHGARVDTKSPCVAVACNYIFTEARGVKHVGTLLSHGGNPNVRVDYPSEGGDTHPRLYSIHSRARATQSLCESALCAIAVAYDLQIALKDIVPSKDELDIALDLLEKANATLSPSEITNYSSLGKGSFALQLVEKQNHREQIPVRTKQAKSWMFEPSVFSFVVGTLDYRTLCHIAQTCTAVRSLVNTNENWQQLIDRDYPGEEMRDAPKLWKSRYMYLRKNKVLPACEKVGGNYSLTAGTDNFHWIRLEIKGSEFTYAAGQESNSGYDHYQNYAGTVAPLNKYCLILTSTRTDIRSIDNGCGAPYSEENTNKIPFMFCKVSPNKIQVRCFSDTRGVPFPFVEFNN